MRTKSEAKRLKILEAASEVFRLSGFERASMSEICANAGYSRATLYSYFPSKEELFLEVMFTASQTQVDAIHEALDPATQNIEDSLNRFGQKLLAFINSPDILAVRRLAIAEVTRSEFRQEIYARSIQQGHLMITAFLKAAMDSGKLRQADPVIASAHLTGLLESELVELLYRTDLPAPEPERIERIAMSAIEVFMAAYGPIPRT
jgi:AcrR family transcriptional regulator